MFAPTLALLLIAAVPDGAALPEAGAQGPTSDRPLADGVVEPEVSGEQALPPPAPAPPVPVPPGPPEPVSSGGVTFGLTGSLLGGASFPFLSSGVSGTNAGLLSVELGALLWPTRRGPSLMWGASVRAGFDFGALPTGGDFGLTLRGGLGALDERWPESGRQGFSLSMFAGPVVARRAAGFRAGLTARAPLGGLLYGRVEDPNFSLGGLYVGGGNEVEVLVAMVVLASYVLLTFNVIEVAVETTYPSNAPPISSVTVSLGYGF